MFTSSVSLLALDPIVPSNHLLSIGGQTKGFFRSRARLPIRFPVRLEKMIENRIAPPQLPGWCCDCLERLQIEGVWRIYSFNRSLSNTDRYHGLSRLGPARDGSSRRSTSGSSMSPYMAKAGTILTANWRLRSSW